MSNQSQQTVLDVDVQQLARVYAKAFLGAAEAKGKTAAWMEELDWLAELLVEHPDLERLVASLLLGAEEKIGLLRRVLADQVSDDMLHFLDVLSRHGRLGLLRAIRSEARHLFNRMQGLVEVYVTSARPLDEPLRAELHQSLKKLLDSEPVIDFRVDPALLGGLVVRVGDRVYDGSIATRLGRARNLMVHQVVDKITANREAFLQGV